MTLAEGGILLLLCIGLGAASARAVEVLDQAHEPALAGGVQFNESPRAQTLVAGVSGQLTRVELEISQLDPAGNLTVSIYALPDGIDGATSVLLASESIPVANLPSSSPGGTGPDWVRFEFDPPASIAAGDELAIIARRDMGGSGGTGGIFWRHALDAYPAGDEWRYDAGGVAVCIPEEICPPFIEAEWVKPEGYNPATGEFEPYDLAFRTWVENGVSVPTLGPLAFAMLVTVLAAAGLATRLGRGAPGARPEG